MMVIFGIVTSMGFPRKINATQILIQGWKHIHIQFIQVYIVTAFIYKIRQRQNSASNANTNMMILIYDYEAVWLNNF